MDGGIVGAGYSIILNNCNSNFNIKTNDNGGKTVIGLIGLGWVDDGMQKCSAQKCSALKFGDYELFPKIDGGRQFNGTISDDCKIFENESEMPNILDVLGENFKMGPNGYPILSWQQ